MFSAQTGFCLTHIPLSGFHHASLLSVTFINQLMHSIITTAEIKIYVIQKSKMCVFLTFV